MLDLVDLGVGCFVAGGGLGGAGLFVVEGRRCWGRAGGCGGGGVGRGTDWWDGNFGDVGTKSILGSPEGKFDEEKMRWGE